MSDLRGAGIAPDPERSLAITRAVALALSIGPLVLLGAVLLVPAPTRSGVLVAPAALAGIVALAIGYRLYCGVLGRQAPGAGVGPRLANLRTATIAGLSVTEATALFGVIAFHLSREPFALAGLAAHLILAGAVWPTGARLDGIL
ncbi:MAG: hypothetical protein LAO51_11365 [Acidobacteriia bacterium]|nr:hypothetical protein [Terriglobia bacterium]